MSSGKDILKTLQKEMMEENKSSMSESLHPKRQMQKDKNGKDRKEMGDEEEEEDMASQSVDFLSENKKSSRSKPEKNVRSNTSRKEEEKPHRMSHTNDKTSSSSSSSSRTAKDSKTTATTPTNSSSAKPKSTTTNTQKKANEGKSVTVTIDQEKERMSKESTKEQGKMNDKDQKITKIVPTSNEKIDEKQKPEEQNSKETAKSVVQPKKSQSVKVEELPKDPRKKKEIDNTGGPKAVTIVKNKDEKGGEGEKSIITTPKSPKTATNTKKSSSENSTGMVKTNSRKRKEISEEEEEEEDDEERENDESNTDKSKRITRAKRVQKVAPEKKVREVRKRVVNEKPKKPLSKGKKMDEQEQEEENDDNNEDSTSEENRVDVASLDQNDSSEVGEMEDGMEENDDALMCDEAIINYKVGKFMDNVQEKKSNEKLIIDNCEDRRVFPKKLRDKVKTHFRTSSAFQKRDTLTCLTQMSIGFLQLVDKFLSKCEKENRKECSKMTPKEKLEFNGRNVDLFVANRDLWRKRRIVRNNLAKKSPHKGTKTSCKGTPKKNKN